MSQPELVSLVPFQLLAFLVPVGLILLAIGAARQEEAMPVMATALTAIGLAVVGYLVLGFGIQFGGVGLIANAIGLQGLTAEWSPLDRAWGPGWGLIGLRGFLLQGEAYTLDAYALFLSQLPAVIAMVLLVLLALRPYLNYGQAVVVGLLSSAVMYPLVGNWIWGGGWLSRLGENLNLGHGIVDAAGAGPTFLLGATVATAGLLLTHRPPSPRKPAELPPVHFPLLLLLGMVLAVCGWPGLVLGNPLIAKQVAAPLVIVNLLFGATAGTLVTSAYSWFVIGQPEALAIGRGAFAGLVATSAACAVVPGWAAILIGGLAGLLMILTLYIWDHVLQFHDPLAVMPMAGIPAAWGLLAVGVLADGRWGEGWNGVGIGEYLGIAGQGVSGLLVGGAYQSPGAAQLQAQAAEVGAIVVTALVIPTITFQAGRWFRASSRRRQWIARQEPPSEETEPICDVAGDEPHASESTAGGEDAYRPA